MSQDPSQSLPSPTSVPSPGGEEELSAAAVLARAADLIEPAGRWTQRAFARPEPGVDWIGPAWPAVRNCWCIRGALMEAAGVNPDRFPERIDTAESFVYRVIQESLVSFNDHPYRTQAEVVAALRNAAELALAASTAGPIGGPSHRLDEDKLPSAESEGR